MKVLLTNSSGTVDISQLVTGVVWSGDYSQAARKLDLTIAVSYTDKLLPSITIEAGNVIQAYENDTLFFTGFVFTKEKSHKSNEMSVTAFDGAIYLLKNEGAYNFKGMTAEQITKTVCKDFGIETGQVADTNIKQSFVSIGEPLYNIIIKAYTKAAEQNGKKYIALMMKGKLSIVERGTLAADYVLQNDVNIINSTYSESIENMVNTVEIVNETGSTNGSNTVTITEW